MRIERSRRFREGYAQRNPPSQQERHPIVVRESGRRHGRRGLADGGWAAGYTRPFGPSRAALAALEFSSSRRLSSLIHLPNAYLSPALLSPYPGDECDDRTGGILCQARVALQTGQIVTRRQGSSVVVESNIDD